MNIVKDNLSEGFLGSEAYATLVRLLRMAGEDEDYMSRAREFDVTYRESVYGTDETPRFDY